MSDPCQCLWDHEAAMQRLLSLLRQGQSDCVDGDCLTGPDGLFSGPQGMIMWSMLWAALALALFFMRPRSLRGNNEQNAATEKRPPSDDSQDNDRPPPVQ